MEQLLKNTLAQLIKEQIEETAPVIFEKE